MKYECSMCERRHRDVRDLVGDDEVDVLESAELDELLEEDDWRLRLVPITPR